MILCDKTVAITARMAFIVQNNPGNRNIYAMRLLLTQDLKRKRYKTFHYLTLYCTAKQTKQHEFPNCYFVKD